jgi:hypothetical protein
LSARTLFFPYSPHLYETRSNAFQGVNFTITGVGTGATFPTPGRDGDDIGRLEENSEQRFSPARTPALVVVFHTTAFCGVDNSKLCSATRKVVLRATLNFGGRPWRFVRFEYISVGTEPAVVVALDGARATTIPAGPRRLSVLIASTVAFRELSFEATAFGDIAETFALDNFTVFEVPLLNFFGPCSSLAPTLTPAPTPAPTPKPKPGPTPKPTPAPTPAPTTLAPTTPAPTTPAPTTPAPTTPAPIAPVQSTSLTTVPGDSTTEPLSAPSTEATTTPTEDLSTTTTTTTTTVEIVKASPSVGDDLALIIGCAVGGTVFCVLVIALIACLSRRSKRRPDLDAPSTPMASSIYAAPTKSIYAAVPSTSTYVIAPSLATNIPYGTGEVKPVVYDTSMPDAPIPLYGSMPEKEETN